jgi:methyltransferase (TIGR00027 family)
MSAQNIALARAQLTWMGIVDDPWAETFLRPGWARLGRGLRRWPLERLAHNRAFAYLAARTRFYDEAVTRACDDGIRQVVVVAAGYDSRAWRLARPAVRFFEVDRRATQADKLAHAPGGGPAYVPMDLDCQRLRETLPAAGFVLGKPAMFTVEGLTMYLDEAAVSELLALLATLGGPNSQLAIDFGINATGNTPTERVLITATRVMAVLGKEPLKFTLEPTAATDFLGEAGWTARGVLTGPDLALVYLAGVGLPSPHPRSAFVATATRT